MDEVRFEPIGALNAGHLWEMLYQAIFTAPGADPPDRAILHAPELARYAQGWGRQGDLGFYALAGGEQPLGAAWLRVWSEGSRGYGWVDDLTPELSLAVLPDFRGQGIGSRLLAHLLDATRSTHARISLSVTAANPAVRLYRRAGFRTVGEEGGSLTMLLERNL